jgi:hypothetical protein
VGKFSLETFVLMQTSEHTEEVSSLQKAADFVRAFIMGFEVQVIIISHSWLPHLD